MNLEIEYLADRMGSVPTLAGWHQDEWGARTPHLSLDDRIARFEAWGHRSGIPIAFVAVSDGVLAGCASLVEHDMNSRTDLSPWLASVLVAPGHRRRGIGSALSERVAREAQVLGFDKLYLFTFDKEPFYARLGWAMLDHTHYLGAPVTIMVRRLCWLTTGSSCPREARGGLESQRARRSLAGALHGASTRVAIETYNRHDGVPMCPPRR